MISNNIPPHTSVFLPSIRSGWNVGAFFRTADSLGIEKIFLSGLTPTPPHKEISKTALDADCFVPWTYFSDDITAVEVLKSQGIKIIALELTNDAVDLGGEKFLNFLETQHKTSSPMCLMLGNEVTGISEELLSYADITVFIPMQGKKQSMNVSIAGALAMWEIKKGSKKTSNKKI